MEMAKMDSDVIAPWLSIAQQVSQESGTPLHWILGVIGAESFGNRYAMSRNPDGSPLAYGLMQLLPQFHFPKGSGQDYWYDPLNNIRAGAKYLKSFIDKGYDLPRAAAAYNAGHLAADPSSDWGFHTDPNYVTHVVARANYAYDKLAAQATPSEASIAPMMLGGLVLAGGGYLLYRRYKKK